MKLFDEHVKDGERRRTENKNNGRIVQRCHRCVALVQLYAFGPSPSSETPPTRLEGQKFAGELNSTVGDTGKLVPNRPSRRPVHSLRLALRTTVVCAHRDPSGEARTTNIRWRAQLRGRQHRQRHRSNCLAETNVWTVSARRSTWSNTKNLGNAPV